MPRPIFATVLVVLVTLGGAIAQGPAPSLLITLSTPQTSMKAGAEIWVDVVTTNLSDRTVKIGFLPGPYEARDFSVTLQVRDGHNQPVGPEKVDQSACKNEPNCQVVFTASRYLDAGKSAKDHFFLDKQKYDLSHPGGYTIQVVREDKLTGAVVKSNIVDLRVTP